MNEITLIQPSGDSPLMGLIGQSDVPRWQNDELAPEVFVEVRHVSDGVECVGRCSSDQKNGG